MSTPRSDHALTKWLTGAHKYSGDRRRRSANNGLRRPPLEIRGSEPSFG
jgi:hypothetical protein